MGDHSLSVKSATRAHTRPRLTLLCLFISVFQQRGRAQLTRGQEPVESSHVVLVNKGTPSAQHSEHVENSVHALFKAHPHPQHTHTRCLHW